MSTYFRKNLLKTLHPGNASFNKKEKSKGKPKLSVACDSIEEAYEHTNLSPATVCEVVKAKSNIYIRLNRQEIIYQILQTR